MTRTITARWRDWSGENLQQGRAVWWTIRKSRLSGWLL
jgi:hypothetical protein